MTLWTQPSTAQPGQWEACNGDPRAVYVFRIRTSRLRARLALIRMAL